MKPYIKVFKQGNNTIVESLQPNDQLGDLAFEWDLDGSQRRKWEEYLRGLSEKGTLGDLVFQRTEFVNNPELDEVKEKNLSSVRFEVFDISK